MPLSAGTTFGNYEIVASIGVGGMGEVYQARDKKLDREVAVKVLPTELARDKERLTRFEREAKLLAQLNHTNIATIHGLEEHDAQQVLVMELVEGETLAERIARGPIAIDETIAIFTQIAEGLEAAHDKGIIHRDLKPANVMIAPDGHVKILDFGLAKAYQDDAGPSEDASQSPTRLRQGFGEAGTRAGVILGTASYMSPEQARGRLVDKRTDLWAFGCCLCEALTGRKAFVGETTTDTLAAIVNAEPDWIALPSATPESIRRLLRRCFSKNVRDRLGDAGTARLELNEPANETTAALKPPQRVAWLAGLTLAAVVVGVTWSLRAPPAAREVSRLSIIPPPGYTISLHSGVARGLQVFQGAVISPDGKWVAYAAGTENGESQLFLRAVDDFTTEAIDAGSPAAISPAFSPDSRWLGFYDQSEGRVMRVRIGDDRPESVCEIGLPLGLAWNGNGGLVAALPNAGLWRCDLGGSEPESITVLDPDRPDINHWTPHVLPGGSALLLTVGMGTRIELGVARRGEDIVRLLGVEGNSPHYVSSGHIVYGVDGELRAVGFDIAQLELVGSPVRLLRGVAYTVPQTAFSIANNGTLVYVAGDQQFLYSGDRFLTWVTRDGKTERLAAPILGCTNLHIDPEGTRVAFEARGDDTNVWVWDLEREALTRTTFSSQADGRQADGVPLWSSNETLLFESHRAGQGNVYEKAADGTGDARRMSESSNHQVPLSISPDGGSIIIEERVGATANLDLVVLSRESGVTEPLLATEFNETAAAISPDGRWMAYQSDESGQPEIYVRTFPNVQDRKWSISSTGGSTPVWSRDGRELFFLDGETHLSRVTVQTGSRFDASRPERVLEQPFFSLGRDRRSYDVSADGSRFLMIEEIQDGDKPREIQVVLNWLDEVERLIAEATH